MESEEKNLSLVSKELTPSTFTVISNGYTVTILLGSVAVENHQEHSNQRYTQSRHHFTWHQDATSCSSKWKNKQKHKESLQAPSYAEGCHRSSISMLTGGSVSAAETQMNASSPVTSNFFPPASDNKESLGPHGQSVQTKSPRVEPPAKLKYFRYIWNTTFFAAEPGANAKAIR